MARKKRGKNIARKEEVPTEKADAVTKSEAKAAKEAKEEKAEETLKEEQENVPKKYVPLALFILGLIAGMILGAATFSKSGSAVEAAPVNLSEAEMNALGQNAVDFIANPDNMLVPEESEVKLVNVTSVGDTGMYQIVISIGYGGSENTYESYISRDAELLCPTGILTGEYAAQIAERMEVEEEMAQMTAEEKCAEMTKTDSPVLEAYVVSMCPYGLQMQRIMAEIVKKAPEAANYLKVRYIGSVVDGKVTAMHGDTEAQENLRQICVREEQSDLYWAYVGCFMKEGKTDACLTEAGIDTEALDVCMSDPEKGIAYAQEDFSKSNSYGVTGSPTLIMNGKRVSEFDFGGRTAQAVKMTLCCGFNSEPEFCSTEMTTASAAAGLSAAYSGAASSGSC
ncbi:MAG: DsbA family protein [Candidatus Aenigmatarchaeota archaeon]